MGFFSSIKKLWGGDAVSSLEEHAPASTSPDGDAWRAPLLAALGQAEPRLSAWIALLLQDTPQAGPVLWERLGFLFDALAIPAVERDAFISAFSSWLDAMGYRAVDEFRSELQYRLALALDLEDEEDERNRLLLKLSDGLARTREQVAMDLERLFSRADAVTDALWGELETVLIAADMGMPAAKTLVARLRRRAAREKVAQADGLRALLQEELAAVFKTPPRIQAVVPPEVVLLVGVNGSGKTTTIAKLAYRAKLQGKKVLVAAADTFRAAAIEQLEVWSTRAGVQFHAKAAGADPAAVAFEALGIALDTRCDLLLVDTAGRLHTQTNLMEELGKIRRVLDKRVAGAPHRSILVLDASTGQNALSQTRIFHETCRIDEIILTKLDGTAKGGIVAAVAMQFGIPISFIGLGEKMEDLRPFDAAAFARAFFEGPPARETQAS